MNDCDSTSLLNSLRIYIHFPYQLLDSRVWNFRLNKNNNKKEQLMNQVRFLVRWLVFKESCFTHLVQKWHWVIGIIFFKKPSNAYQSVTFSFILSVFLNLWSSVLLLQRMYSKVNSKTCMFLCRLSPKLTICFPFGPNAVHFCIRSGTLVQSKFQSRIKVWFVCRCETQN